MQIGQFFTMSGRDVGSLAGASLPRGAIRLDSSIGGFDSENMTQVESAIEENKAHIVWATADGALRVASDWTCDSDTGVWRRKDAVKNTGSQAVAIHRALARFVLAPGQYDVYAQSSAWCKENQGAWKPVEQGGVILRSEGGQTCRGASPYVCIRESAQKTGVAFHVLPCGNWTIRVLPHTPRLSGPAFLVVELGLDDDHLRLTLPAGQSLDLPDVLFQPVPNGDPALAAPAFHRYVSTRLLPAARPDVPVIYNTWFDVHEWFTVDRLRRQLAAARQIGCEVFVIDAGWYGAGVGQWHEQVGDWREKLDGAFHGRMADFAAEVRATGLGFGLWMEPERLAAGVPIVRERPQWFLSSDGKHYWPNLDDPDAYAYLLGEMSRLVTTYKLAWMKVDFNFERGVDPSGSEFAWYYRAWYRLMDELRARHPSVVFEGCASGGLRFDLSTLSHFDGHFLSDTVTPLDVLRIYQGMMLRLPPGRTTKWAVLGASKRDAAGLPVADARAPTIMAPVGANWRQSTPTTVDFAARVALSGIFGVSGDIASLAKPALDRLAYHVAFFKKWRNFIVTSVGHLLTPPCPIDDGRGWAAVQLQGAQDTTSLLFVYRLNDAAARQRFALRGMDLQRKYTVLIDDRLAATMTGKQLMEEGITVTVASRNGAQIAVVTPT